MFSRQSISVPIMLVMRRKERYCALSNSWMAFGIETAPSRATHSTPLLAPLGIEKLFLDAIVPRAQVRKRNLALPSSQLRPTKLLGNTCYRKKKVLSSNRPSTDTHQAVTGQQCGMYPKLEFQYTAETSVTPLPVESSKAWTRRLVDR